MKIKLWLPVFATAEFEAEIDVNGKTAEEIFDEFCDFCRPTGSLYYSCDEPVEVIYSVDDNSIDLENYREKIENLKGE